ncbi:hypothetical protein [Belliella pelovolcani]|uniref:Uncharacterized protein n=1 Tax=Belliella pelovolcani TaxID=529505 RepID=A0A1N7MV30_9BACT|nr:hypothetical protein [Belliella pelovolcani]SIS90004.1 hypothetical protein SAMN05421761_107174 [Belliella pelovolcani]
MKNNSIFYDFLLAGAFLAMASCEFNVEDVVPTTVEVDLAFALTEEDDNFSNVRTLNRLTINEAVMNVRKLDVRVLGQLPIGSNLDRNFTFDFPDTPKRIVYTNDENGQDINIRMPRASYRQVMFDLDIVQAPDDVAASLAGEFETSLGEVIPVKYELYGEIFNFDGKFEAKDRNEALEFDQLDKATMLVELHAIKWFNDISAEEFENAEIIDGVMLINPETNSSIYEKIKARIIELTDIKIRIRIHENGHGNPNNPKGPGNRP